ncbi:ATP-binding cassette domain-containing protein [Wenzhouxiangella sp. XN24]|uniref:ATP-binding cassette domain-containing protein n=1 Tax=Wenzhouxiangella sp. XN24 TaxID=2713569 RepID=UPI0013EDA9E2|nr:ATP-binding cassette domain-containing protein [Wenzhouxiangella sp. XN24]NGX14747.1 ATP-binding cassette domain-containing protein [Wenzhouxiangella sp. XN24]
MVEVRAGYARPVVGPVSFRIGPGEVLGLGGANGIGKTTLLRLITGTAVLHGGRVERAPGLTVAHHRQRPERPPELPLTGHEVLRLAGAPAAPVPARLDALGRRCLDELSGGEFQLLHAWACLTGPSRLVLLDEPTNNLDTDAIELLLAEIGRLDPARAVLIVSHDGDFLAAACDRIVTPCP